MTFKDLVFMAGLTILFVVIEWLSRPKKDQNDDDFLHGAGGAA